MIAQAGLPRRLRVSRAEPIAAPPASGGRCTTTKPGALQCLYKLLGDDASHHLVSAVRPLACVKLQRVGDSLGDVLGLRGRQLLGVAHAGQVSRGD